jgi:itaconate CoA-transferase
MSAEQVVGRLDAAQIANAAVNTMAEVWAHPQLQARGRWVEIETPAGLVPALLPPGLRDASDARMDAVPALGQHSAALLAELGFAPNEIDRLRAEGAIQDGRR